MQQHNSNRKGQTPPFLQNAAGDTESGPAKPQKSFADYWTIIKRRWWMGLIIGILLGGASWYKANQVVPLYKARAVIFFEQETDRVLNIEEVVSSSLRGLVDTILRNHHTMMISNTFRARVVESLTPEERELIVAPYRDKDTNPNPSLHGIIAGANKIHRGGDNTFFIEFQHRSPEAAALLANRFLDEYNQYMIDRKREGNSSAMRFLRARAEELRLRVEQSELDVQAYRKNSDLVSLEENQNLVVKRLQALDSSLTSARIGLLELQTTMEQIQKTRETGEDLFNLPAIANYGSIPQLLNRQAELKTNRGILETRYGIRHPNMVENTQALKAVEKELKASRDLAIKQLENNLERQKKEVQQFENALAEAEKEALELDRVAIEYNVLRRKLEADRQLFDQITSRLNETTVASQLSITNLRIVDRAAPPNQPFMPDTKDNLTKSLGIFAVCFIGFPFLVEYFDKRIKSSKDIEFHLRRLHLGNIPKMSRKQLREGKSFAEASENLDSERFRGIFGQMEIYSHIPYPKTILVTSSIPQEGKSFFISHFAYHLSESNKKVLIIDADFRNPRQHQNFQIQMSTGSNEWLRNRNRATRPPMLRPDDELPPIHRIKQRLYLMPAGRPYEKPTEILTSETFTHLIRRLQEDYDLILIDSPPAGVFSDASLLTKVSDEMIYLIKYKAMNRVNLKNIIRDLEQSQARFLGTVLNFAKDENLGKNRYYYKYKDYYSKRSKKEKSHSEEEKTESETSHKEPLSTRDS